MKLKIKTPSGTVKITKEEAQRLKEVFAFFASDAGKKALVYFRSYCGIGGAVDPSNGTSHTFLCGRNEPYNRIVEDMRWGYLISNGSSQIKVLNPVEEDVYAGGPNADEWDTGPTGQRRGPA